MAKRSIRKTRHVKMTATLRGRKSELLKKLRHEISDTEARAKVILAARNRGNARKA